MKKSFTNFLKRNLAAARIAVLSHLEYRVNFAVDVIVQPMLTCGIEVMLWMAILTGMGTETLGGYGREYYLAYALWANFIGRVAMNWMYEFTMLDDIESGKLNSILVRPISFYEFYLSQFMGYKLLAATFSFGIPVIACVILKVPFHIERLPMLLAMMFMYLIFTHTLSFMVACFAFHMSRATSITAMKNLAIWVVSGEMIPLDLYPEPWRDILMHSPFAAGVYLPVSYITGRLGSEHMIRGYTNLAIGTVVVGLIAAWMWKRGIRSYVGTGA